MARYADFYRAQHGSRLQCLPQVPVSTVDYRATQSRTRDLELGGAQIDQAPLMAVPAHLARLPAGVLWPGNRFGGHHQQLFDKLSRQSTQQVLDRQLGLPNHR